MKIKSILNKFMRTALSYEWTCNVCGTEIFNEGYFCKECNEKLKIISACRCNHCGRLTENPTLFCESCSGKNTNFDMARSVYAYNESVAKIITNFKYHSKTYLQDIFAEELVDLYLSNFLLADYLTYIPMTEERFNERGYNQSKLIADKMSEKLQIPVLDLVDKVVETTRQATLTASERQSNLKNSFKGKKIDLTGKTVIVIDDVLTTGVTMDLVAKELKKMGAEKVYALTVASVGKKINQL